MFFHHSITQTYILQDIVSVVPDEKDNYLFALCAISNADYFVTGDKLLLDVDTYKHTKVITLADFKAIINSL
jgi:predicted nucleic acid-binding protein